MKCPKCGYETPKQAYEYTGYLLPYLPTILKLLRMGQSPGETCRTLQSLHGNINSEWGTPPVTMIHYIAKRYGLLKPQVARHNEKRDAEIAEKYFAGDTTMQALADEYDLSRERIRGIIHSEERRAERTATAQDAYFKAESIEEIPLDAVGLPIRIAFCLMNAGCKTVGDAMKLSDEEMIRTPNFGTLSLRQWHEFLGRLQVEFAASRQAPETTAE